MERVRVMKGFTDLWFITFGTWPGYRRPGAAGYPDEDRHLIEMLSFPAEELREKAAFGSGYMNSQAAYEVGVRRRLLAEPASAPEIIKQTQEKKWPPSQGQTEPQAAGPSIELLIIWAKVDLPAMIHWADSLDIRKDDVAATVKGFLMSRVDAGTCDRWLTDAKSADEKLDRTESLLSGWAGWDPKPALEMAVANPDGDTDAVLPIVLAAAEGPWGGYPRNTNHSGLSFMREFDPTRMPEPFRANHFSNWEIIVEGWGEIDIGEAARYGVDFLLSTNYTPRENLIKFFSGEDGYKDDAMIDRTFCALRVWAVVKPREMKAWIGTSKEADMRKALTWLLEHPWGTGPKE